MTQLLQRVGELFEARADRLQAQFTALEQLVSNLQAQGNSLLGLFGGG